MNFKYYNYQQNLFKEIISSEAEVYLFKNYQDLNEALKVYQPGPLTKQSLFLTLDEFQKRLISSDQIVLKKEKLPLILYSVLNKEEKSELRLESYQDIYQFSDRFFAYFNLLQDYQLQNLVGLTEWQKLRSENLKQIKKKYQKRLQKLGYVDYLTLKEKQDLNQDFLLDYKKINFFNILDFSPYLKELVKELAQNFELKFHLQLAESDFDEKELKLKKITLPELNQNKIEIRKSSSELKSFAEFLDEIEKNDRKTEIISSGDEIKEAALVGDKLKIKAADSYQKTELYLFLDSLYQLYQKGKKGSEVLIELKTLYDLTTQKLFRNWLNLSFKDLAQIRKLVEAGYYYLDSKVVAEKVPILDKLFDFLQKLKKMEKISDLIELFTEKFTAVLNERPKEEVEKFNDGLLEIKSIEEMKIVENWQAYYSDKGGGFFALFLNHLSFKQIKNSNENGAQSLKLLTVQRAAQRKRNKLLVNNCLQKDFSLNQNGLYFLSEKQLQDNDLNIKEKNQLLKRYNFLRHIFNADEVVIFTSENEAENIFPAVILEELALEYKLDFKSSNLEKISEKEILNNLFNYETEKALESYDLLNFNQNLSLDDQDFKNYFNFSYYKYKYLKDCYHRFYLEQLINLKTSPQIEPALSLMDLGILTHNIFGELIVYAREQKINPVEIKAELRKEIIKTAIKENELKIDKDYLNYYYQVIFKSLENSFIYFAELLSKYLPKNKNNILVEWPEWDYQREKYFETAETDFYLSGRIDLLLMREEDYFIIDFKTGSGDKKQLDFYSLMLRQNYKEKLPEKSRKAIYNVFAEELEHSYNQLEKEEKLGAEIKRLTENLFAVGEYERVFKSRCNNCPYLKICRVEVQTDEKSH